MSEKVILGIDEVGRGPWAGPLLVGAVILGHAFKELPEYAELTDSKKLSAKKREQLSGVILKNAAATGFGWVSSTELDRDGLGPALKLAARRAVKEVLAKKVKFDEIIIDGTINLLTDTPLEARTVLLPKADLLIKEVSAASIIAKVARDRYMIDLAEKYPEYGFEKHVGYGTAAHRAAIERIGICPEHRQSFRPIAKILENATPTVRYAEETANLAQKPRHNVRNAPRNAVECPKNVRKPKPPSSTARGQKAEELVLSYLKEEGHEIIAHNFRTRLYEIDLISVKDNTIFFTEVKSRLRDDCGSPLEQITPKKHAQIRIAATDFLANHPKYAKLSPVLAAAGVSGMPPHLDEWIILPD